MTTPLIKNPAGSAQKPLGEIKGYKSQGYKSRLPLSHEALKSKSCSWTRTCSTLGSPRAVPAAPHPEMDKHPTQAPTHAPNSHAPAARRDGISSTDLPKDGASLRVGFVAHSSLESLYSVRAGSKSGRETPTPRECNTHTEINSSLPKGMTQESHHSLKHKSLLINPRKLGGRPSKRSTGQDLAFP